MRSDAGPMVHCESNHTVCRLCKTPDQCLDTPPASPWILSRARRVFDVVASACVLIVFAIPIFILAILVRLTSPGPAFFAQKRVGLRGRLFTIYKFRSMRQSSAERCGVGLTKAGDSRITPLGRFMRKLKLDELPQFYNILCGDMSFVGPRPKLPEYAALRNQTYRPGITGAASIAFRNEEEMLRGLHRSSIEAFYEQHIKPVKAHIDACYMCNATPATDLRIILNTFLCCLAPRSLESTDVARVRAPSARAARRAEPIGSSFQADGF